MKNLNQLVEDFKKVAQFAGVDVPNDSIMVEELDAPILRRPFSHQIKWPYMCSCGVAHACKLEKLACRVKHDIQANITIQKVQTATSPNPFSSIRRSLG